MENRQEHTTRLERQVRMWRAAALCCGMLAVAGGPLGVVLAQAKAADAARLRTARPSEIVTIDIPAQPGLDIQGENVESDAKSGEYTLSGVTRLAWKSGLQVRSNTAVVRLVRDPQTGAARVFIEPPAGAAR